MCSKKELRVAIPMSYCTGFASASILQFLVILPAAADRCVDCRPRIVLFISPRLSNDLANVSL